MKSVRIFPILTGMIILSSILACNEPKLDSNWKSTGLSSDEPDSVWVTSSVYSLEGKNVSIGLENDADNLYILLKASDRQTQARIMRAGLTIWLDAAGKKNMTFGIHYPLGMPGQMPFPQGDRQAGENQEQIRGLFAEMADTMEIIGPKKDERIRVPIVNGLGPAAMTDNDNGTITYELRIPLRSTNNSAYALNIDPGKVVGLGLETGKFVPSQRDWRGQGGRSGGRRGGHDGGFGGGGFGGGFGGHGGMGGHRGEGRPPGEENQGNSSGPLKFWAKVKLASKLVNQD
jgi:hypothetical protein